MKRRTWIIFLCIAVCATLFGGNVGAERSIKIRTQFDGTTLHKEFSTGTNYAVIIGISEYENHPNLKTALNDANAVAKLLEEKYFFEKQNIVFLKDRDATKDHIMQEFRDLVAEKVKKVDNVFIYYAGHGWFDDILESGYWVTTEATKSPATFLENNTIYKFIAALDKKGVQHVLLVSDSCFSGSFTKDYRAIETDIDDRYFREKYSKPSRNVITSGGMEPVEDVGKEGHSIFAYYFLKTLKDNPHPYLSAKQLGVQVEELVTRNSIQTPISKFIHGVGDEGGQFFFINRKSGTPKVSPGPITTKAQDSTELQKEIKRLELERLELERLKVEIESKKLEAERKRLEAEKRKMAKLPPEPKYSPPTAEDSLVPPSEVTAGSFFKVNWNGPDNRGDYITIVPAGASDTEYMSCAYTSEGSPATLKAPDKPGKYEVRYIMQRSGVLGIIRRSRSVFARANITVTPVSAKVRAEQLRPKVKTPASVAAGANFEVAWTGPDNRGDYITIVPAGASDTEYMSCAYTSEGSPAALKAPDKPGQYEVRYILDQSRTALARAPIVVK